MQFGGQTPLKLAAGLDAGRRAAARHQRRGDRPGRGPRTLRRAARPPRPTRPRRTPRPLGCRRRSATRRRGRLPAARAPVLRARRAGDGDRLRPRRPAPTTSSRHATANGGGRGDLPRPLPRERDRGRRRRAVRRRRGAGSAAIMQHVEEAGIHSGDSACVLPPHSLGDEMLAEIREQTPRDRARPRGRRPAQRPVRGATATSST